jgi:tRNA-2-methylthio-N6-dimethylallyladenosine synthase
MKPKKYFIETYGCEMNKSDSVDIALSLQAGGYAEAVGSDDADVVVLNTCSVREHAEERIHGRLGYYRSLNARREGGLLIVLAGCMAQEQGYRLIERFPEIKAVVGTYHGWNIAGALQTYHQTGRPVVLIDQERYHFSPFKGQRARGHSAWVNIIMGCSNFCTYCIVPYLRGPEKSKPADQVIEEVRQLVDHGVVEITLLGQNVNAYGKDRGGPNFVQLLERIGRIEGIRWIRFLTSHPRDFDEEIVRRIAGMEKVCNHLHLPLQSGSDRILGLMNRQYDMRHYRSVIDAVRTHMENPSITTDVIVGFPTETGEDFNQTLDVVREVGYDDAFTYKYSARPFTEALRIFDTVDGETAGRRLEALIELQRSVSLRRNREEIGNTCRALVERRSKKDSCEMLCRTERNKMVVVHTSAHVGSFIEVELQGLSGHTLRGVEVCTS